MNDQSLKEKGITINGKGGTPEKLGSLYGNGAALQGISERLEKQTQKIKEQMDQNKKGGNEDSPVAIATENKKDEEVENLPAEEFVQLVLGRAVDDLEKLDGRLKRGLEGFVERLAQELSGTDTSNVEKVNQMFSDFIEAESQKTKLGKILKEKFQLWDGKFGDEQDDQEKQEHKTPAVDIKDENAENKINLENSHGLSMEVHDDGEKIVEQNEHKSFQKRGSEDGSPENQKEKPKKEVRPKHEEKQDDIPRSLLDFKKKFPQFYFVNKQDASDLKVISFNPKSGMVQFELGQRFIIQEPEKDEEGEDVATYSLGEKGKITSLPYEKFVKLLDGYVTDEDFNDLDKEISQKERAGFFEDVSTKFINERGDVLRIGKYKPGKKIGAGHTREAGDVSVRMNGGKIKFMTLDKFDELIKEKGFVLEKSGKIDPEKEEQNKNIAEKPIVSKKDENVNSKKKVSDERKIKDSEENLTVPKNEAEEVAQKPENFKFSEKEKKILDAYKVFAKTYLEEIETYDYVGAGVLDKYVPNEKKRQIERFWEVVLPATLKKRSEFSSEEMIERAMEEIGKIDQQ